MRCRLLFLIGQLHQGGSERQLFYLLREMDRTKYQPMVAVWNFNPHDPYVSQFNELAVPLLTLGGRERGPREDYGRRSSVSKFRDSVSKVWNLHRIVRKLRPEIVHCYSYHNNYAAHWATRRTNTVAIGSIRSSFKASREGSVRWLGRLNGRWPRNQISNNRAAAEDVAKYGETLFIPERLTVVRNGIDLKLFKCRPLPRIQPPRIVGIGTLNAKTKRWDRVINAAAALKQNGLDCILQLVGDGPDRSALLRQVEMLGLGERVQMLGSKRINEIGDVLADATLLVHCSQVEGCPNAVMEAMACGRPVVATDVGEIPYLVEDGKTGFIVPGGDCEVLVTRISQLINDPCLCRMMGERGRAKAENEFRLERLVAESLDAYRSAGWRERE